MAEATNELLLSVLRQVQGDQSEIRKDINGIRGEMADIRGEMKDIDQKVDGLTVMFALLAGHVRHAPQRVEALENART